MEYGSCVWSVGYLENERRIERLQRKWTREINGLTGLDYVSRLKNFGLHSIEGRLLRVDLIQIWKAFHSDIDVGLSDIFEYPRKTPTGGHAYKLSNNVEAFKVQIDRFLGGQII